MSLLLPLDAGGPRPSFAPATPVDFVNHSLPFYDSQYVRVDQLRVAIVAFNVATKKPPSDLSPLRAAIFAPRPQQQQAAAVGDAAGAAAAATAVEEPDVIVFGLQEVDMSASALLREETEAALPWTRLLLDLTGCDVLERSTTSRYYLIAAKQLVGLQLVAMVRRASIDPRRIREVSVGTVATGALGTVANKGAIGIRISLERSSYCIINAHLAAHQHASSRRNQDIADILARMNVSTSAVQESIVNMLVASPFSTASTYGGIQQPAPPPAGAAGHDAYAELVALSSYLFVPLQLRAGMMHAIGAGHAPAAYLSQVLAASPQGPVVLPRDCDHVIVFGDLNYRVDTTYESAVQLARRGDVKALLKDDQLTRELKHPHSPWFGFTDLVPTFLPTYRFDIGTDVYDTSDKRRIPAFTDRILFWSRPSGNSSSSSGGGGSNYGNNAVSVVRYDSVMKVMSSDHKPVYGLLSLPLRCTEPKLLEETTARLRALVVEHGLQNVSRPSICIDTSALDFGAERSALDDTPTTRTVCITNTGKCVAECAVLRRNRDDASDATWLRVPVCSFNVLPGETYALDVSCVLDWASLRWAADISPFSVLSPVFALRSELVVVVRGGGQGGTAGNTLAGGAVVTCTCTVKPTCFAMTIDMLLRCGNTPVTQAYALKSAPAGSAMRPHVPKELWFLADAIVKFPTVPGLFTDFAAEKDAFAVLMALSTTNECLPNVVACPAEQCPPGSTSVYAAAMAFVLLLRDLQISVIPANLLAAAAAATKAGPQAVTKFATEQLPTAHFNCLIYVVSLLRFLLRPQHTASNELTPQLLAEIFAVVLFSLSSRCRPPLGPRPLWLTTGAAAAAPFAAGAGAAPAPSASGLRAQADEEIQSATKFLLTFLA